MSKYFSAKDLKSPDKFLKALVRVRKYLKDNTKFLLIIGVSVIVVTSVVVTINHFIRTKEENARKELYKVLTRINNLDENEKQERTVLLINLLDKIKDTDASRETKYKIAEEFYKQGKWDEAIKYYSMLTDSEPGLFQELALLGKAYALEMKKDYKSAINVLEKLKANDDAVYRGVAMLSIGRCYAKDGNEAKAREAYDSVTIMLPDSDYAKLASVAKSELKVK